MPVWVLAMPGVYVCLSQFSILSKRMDKLFFLTWRLSLTYSTVCSGEIQVSTKIRVPYRYFPQELCPVAFSALTMLVGWQEGHPACKKLSSRVLAWLSAWSEVQTCICPADATATHCLLLQ